MPLKKQLIIRALILVVAIPLANSFGLRLLYSYEIAGNIAYENIEPIISGAIPLFEAVSVFSGFGLFLRAYFELGWRGAGPILALDVLSALVPYCAGMVLLILTTGMPDESLPYAAAYAAANFLADIATLAVVVAAAAAISNSAKKRGGVSSAKLFRQGCVMAAVVFAVAGLILRAAETAIDIIEFGAPVEIGDFVYLAVPYMRVLSYSMLGMFVAFFAGSPGLESGSALRVGQN